MKNKWRKTDKTDQYRFITLFIPEKEDIEKFYDKKDG